MWLSVIYDISMMIHEDMQVYKNKVEKKPIFKASDNLSDGGSYETTLTMNLHTGTHLDYPLHMIKNGETSNIEVLENLITSCQVFDLSDVDEEIKKKDLEDYEINQGDFVLLKTKNSFSENYLPHFTYLGEEAAQYLADKGVKGVGIDALGIERNQLNHPTHHILLSRGIIIIEGLRLKAIKEKSYQMICLPLKIKQVEATPARIILKD